ncbi:MAG: TIGR03546 family protein [Sinobacterium sp.]|nr:TIGR03546 family protein [Sinobacterium sp.]
MLAQCLKLFRALNSDVSPWQISLGLNLGLMLGLLPLYTPSAIFVIFIACILRVNIASFLLAFGVFSGIAWFFDQSILQLGESLLYASQWQDLWSSLYKSDFFLFLQFHHTQVMGGWAISLLLLPLGFVSSQIFIIKYRTQFLAWLKTTKAIQWLEMNKWYQRGLKASNIAAELT